MEADGHFGGSQLACLMNIKRECSSEINPIGSFVIPAAVKGRSKREPFSKRSQSCMQRGTSIATAHDPWLRTELPLIGMASNEQPKGVLSQMEIPFTRSVMPRQHTHIPIHQS